MRHKNLYYGSLRAGEYNCEAFKREFGEESFKYVGTKTIEGYELHSLGAYPVIIPNPNSTVVVDEFEVSDAANEAVRWMEEGAGYSSAEIDGATIWYMDRVPSYSRGKVEHGDWSKYLRENG